MRQRLGLPTVSVVMTSSTSGKGYDVRLTVVDGTKAAAFSEEMHALCQRYFPDLIKNEQTDIEESSDGFPNHHRWVKEEEVEVTKKDRPQATRIS